MSLPPTPVLQALKKSSASMANRSTPFVYNEWYVAAFSSEVTREFLPRILLEKRVVLFRTEAGEAVALSDRCAHRAYPLSLGKLEGDTIVCGYHGFRFNAEGDCVDVPSSAKCPRDLGVARYRVVERGPLVWIWMGNPDEADESRLVEQEWLGESNWAKSSGYFELQSNYISMHENLLDLTHLSFLHDCPAAHTFPHAPQFSALVLTSTSQPSSTRLLQSRLSVTMKSLRLTHSSSHLPATHRDFMLSGRYSTHALPHVPQFSESRERSVPHLCTTFPGATHVA